MQDLDFHDVAQAQKTPPVPETAPASRSKLAVVSLVFGILGLTVLPLLGSLIAIVTGFAALGEIRATGGRLGGRAMAKAGLWLGFMYVIIALLAAAVLALVFVGRVESMPATATLVPTPAPAVPQHKPGVKMANELGKFDVEQLKHLGVEDEDQSGELICFYTNDSPEDGEPESAALTTKQIVFMKGDRKTAFELKDIDALMDTMAYRQKYTPNFIDATRFVIEVKRSSGARMRIVIRPYDDGPAFYHALEDAWKAAGDKPENEKPAR